MSLSDTKDSAKYWVKALKFKNNSIAKSALAEFVFRISTPGVDVERTNQVQTRSNDVYNNRRNDLFQLITKDLHIYVIESINDLGVTT